MNKIDKQNLRQVILNFPKQFKVGFELAKNIKIKGKFKTITVSGMGGSSLPADILRAYLKESGQEIELIQNRNYSLPEKAFDKSLNFMNSYSGNTEETIASFEEGLKNKLPMVGFTVGGKLQELCEKTKTPVAIFPLEGIQPRYATGYFVASMLQVLMNAGMIKDNSKEIIKSAEKLSAMISDLEKTGKKIAKKLVKATPIIYSSEKYSALAMIWKIKFNENSKTPAFWNFFPELNHNEMVGYTLPQAKFHILNLIDPDDYPKNILRMRITAKLLKEKGINTTFIEIKGNNLFEKIFSTLILGDWISYYLALEYGQDPTPVDMVEKLKKMLD